MKKLLVFFNFIEASEKALDQAISLAEKDNCKIIICHIINGSEPEADILKKLEPFAEKVRLSGREVSIELEKGAIFEAAAKVSQKIKPDLVIAGTRGAAGFDLSIFGSAIYKFVRDVAYTSLVLHSDSKIAQGGFKSVLLPITPHKNFIKKVRESLKVLADEGEIIIFALKKVDSILDDEIENNKKISEEFLNSEGIRWQYKEFEIKKNENDFAKLTLDKMEELGTDLISISANVSARNQHFGKMHKEDVLMNDYAMPVLCVNTDIE